MKTKTKKKTPVFATVVLIVLIVYMISLVLPMLWAIFSSLKTDLQFKENLIFPTFPFNLDSYKETYRLFTYKVYDEYGGTSFPNYIGMSFNSIIYAVGCALVNTSVLCVTAYTTSRFSFKFDKVIYTLVIITMILPIVGSLPSEIRMVKLLNLNDSFLGMFIMKAHFLGMYYLVFHAMFRGIPKDFDEAAYIDGAGNFSIFFRIILPLASGTFTTIALINFIGFWNDYTTPLIYLPSYPTVALGLYDFVQSPEPEKTPTTYKLAACMLVFIPNFIIFLVFRNKLIGNISMGGLKE